MQEGHEIVKRDEPVEGEARPANALYDAAALYLQKLDEAFEKLRPFVEELVEKINALLGDDPNLRAYQRSRADVAEKRRAIRQQRPVSGQSGYRPGQPVRVRKIMDASPRDKPLP